MRNRPLIVTALIGLFGLLPLSAYAQVAISPPLANISLGASAKPHSFRLMNDSSDPIRVAVTVANWTMNEHGKVETIPPTKQSLAPWLQINPTRFTIPPGQSQIVRYAIRPAVKLTTGEHRAMVFFTQQSDAAQSKKKASLHVYFRFGAAIYGHVGTVHASGEIVSLKADARSATFVLTNTGNATTRMIGRYALWTRAAYPGKAKSIDSAPSRKGVQAPKGLLDHGQLPRGAVLPGARRIVTLAFGKDKHELPPGRYVLRVDGKLGERDIHRTLRFDVSRKTH